MADPWEEALDLDLDDSDLASLRPSKRHHTADSSAAAAVSASQPSLRRCSLTYLENPQKTPSRSTVDPQLIPGPAGTIQSAMIRRRKIPNDVISGDDFDRELTPTQEYIRRAVEEGIEDDGDFSGDPWLRAIDFIRRQGLADGDGAIGIPLSAIKSGFNMDKVSQVVAIVKSCSPNIFGGLMVTLKDPTDTIDATVHGRVLAEGEFGKDISIGSVIILRKVTVFSPSRSAHYINITLSNMIKVFPKDVKVPMEQMRENGVPHIGNIYESPSLRKPSSLPQGMAEEIMNTLKQKEDMKGRSNGEERAVRDKITTNQHTASGKEKLAANTDAAAREMLNILNPSSQAARSSMLGGANNGSSAACMNIGMNNKGSSNAIGTKGNQPIIPTISLPEWTDEQLDELFSCD